MRTKISLIGTAEGDTNGTGVAMPGVLFRIMQRSAGEVNFAMLINVYVVSVKDLAILAAGPVQK